jgi:hypothetical protein
MPILTPEESESESESESELDPELYDVCLVPGFHIQHDPLKGIADETGTSVQEAYRSMLRKDTRRSDLSDSTPNSKKS